MTRAPSHHETGADHAARAAGERLLVAASSAVRALVGEFIARQGDESRRVLQLAITLPSEGEQLLGSSGLRVNKPQQREGHSGYELAPVC